MTDHSNMKLGKHEPRHDDRTLQLEKYLVRRPKLPASLDWTGKVTTWPMMHNDTVGDCTCACAGHMEECWTANASTLFVPGDDTIISAYEAITGYNPSDPNTDQGANVLDVLNYWRNTGIGGHKIAAYAQVKNIEYDVKEAIGLFGGVYLGVALPINAQTQDVWDGHGGSGDAAPGSWGGHAIPVLAYDSKGLTCITWGATKRMTWRFLHAYADELYAIVSQDWIEASGKSPESVDLNALEADLAKL